MGEIKISYFDNVFQINIVCGGSGSGSGSSCEVNIDGEDSWSITNAPLPVAFYGLNGANVANRVLMIGEK